MMPLVMNGQLTVLWLVDRSRVPTAVERRCRHVVGDTARPGTLITRLIGEGPVLAVVDGEDDGRRALAYGVDDFVLAHELDAVGLDLLVDRTLARARGRMLRDMYLIDLVRKDDTDALGLVAAALGRELMAPLARVSEESKELLDAADASQTRDHAEAIARSVEAMTKFVEKTQALLDGTPTDETVDLVRIVHAIATSLAPGVSNVAELRVVTPQHACPVGMPRWQVGLTIANLIANAAQSISNRGAGRGTIELCLTVEDGAAALEVTDDGIGMDPVVRVKANDLFYTTEDTQRLGMGLTLVTARVRRAGGEVIIDSDGSSGTTVRVFLPLLQVPALVSGSN